MIVYKIENKINGKIYIGQTVTTVEHRIKRHLREFGCPAIHRALNKYGLENFEISILDTAKTQDELNELEIKYIQEYGSMGEKGYNLTEGGIGGSKPQTQESKEKIRRGLLGNKNAEGRTVSEETRRLIGAAHKGKTLSPQHIKQLAKARKDFYDANPELVVRGEQCGSAKLKEIEVREIKVALTKYETKLPRGILTELGKKYNVGYSTIKDIYLGITWKHVEIYNEVQ